MSAFSLALPMGAVLVLVACSFGLLVPLVTSLISRLDPRSPMRGATASAALVLAPWVLGALAAAALVSPDPFAACHCAVHGPHHPHLCLVHPTFAGPLLGPAALVLAAWGVLVGPRLGRLLGQGLTSAAWARSARHIPAWIVDGVDVRVVPCGAATALTVGVWSPVIVFDPRLWETLDADARRAVIHHEAGHRLRGDGLTLLALRWADALQLVPGGMRAIRNWQAATEVECDAHAAATVRDPGLVAEALLAALRARSTPEAAAPAHALAAASPEGFEGRVRGLMERTERSPAARLGNDALAVLLGALGAGAVTVVLPGEALHHAFETLVGLAIR